MRLCLGLAAAAGFTWIGLDTIGGGEINNVERVYFGALSLVTAYREARWAITGEVRAWAAPPLRRSAGRGY